MPAPQNSGEIPVDSGASSDGAGPSGGGTPTPSPTPAGNSNGTSDAGSSDGAPSGGEYWQNFGHNAASVFTSTQGGVFTKGAAVAGYTLGSALGREGVGKVAPKVGEFNNFVVNKAVPALKPVAGIGIAVAGAAISGAGGEFKDFGNALSKTGTGMCFGTAEDVKRGAPKPPGKPQEKSQ